MGEALLGELYQKTIFSSLYFQHKHILFYYHKKVIQDDKGVWAEFYAANARMHLATRCLQFGWPSGEPKRSSLCPFLNNLLVAFRAVDKAKDEMSPWVSKNSV